jgi:cytoskeletal protein RodZ
MRETAMVWTAAAMLGVVTVLATGCAETPEPEPFETKAASRAAPVERTGSHGGAGSAEENDDAPSGSKPASPTSTSTKPINTTPTTTTTTPTSTPDGGAKPAGKATWEACASDAECGTNRCGCNGAAKMVCLPSADYPKTCVAPKANWEACGSDAECATDRCGCNGGTEMVCLPSPAYPKTCS